MDAMGLAVLAAMGWFAIGTALGLPFFLVWAILARLRGQAKGKGLVEERRIPHAIALLALTDAFLWLEYALIRWHTGNSGRLVPLVMIVTPFLCLITGPIGLLLASRGVGPGRGALLATRLFFWALFLGVLLWVLLPAHMHRHQPLWG